MIVVSGDNDKQWWIMIVPQLFVMIKADSVD